MLSPYTMRSALEMATRACEVTGQCKKCLELFTVSVYLVDRTPIVPETARMEWTYPTPEERESGILHPYLVHRRGLCNGKVALFGSLEPLFPQGLKPTFHVFPRPSAQANAWWERARRI